MRLKSFIPGIVLGGTRFSNDPLEDVSVAANDPFEDIHGDIKYTPCQAELMRGNDMEIPDTNIDKDIDDDEYCDQLQNSDRGATDNSVQYWKDYFNESTNRFKVPYMFDGSHSEKQKDTIRRKLAEFRQETCVDLVEIPWEDQNENSFSGKYDNAFWVSSNVLY